jgi:hypothetical protein
MSIFSLHHIPVHLLVYQQTMPQHPINLLNVLDRRNKSMHCTVFPKVHNVRALLTTAVTNRRPPFQEGSATSCVCVNERHCSVTLADTHCYCVCAACAQITITHKKKQKRLQCFCWSVGFEIETARILVQGVVHIGGGGGGAALLQCRERREKTGAFFVMRQCKAERNARLGNND